MTTNDTTTNAPTAPAISEATRGRIGDFSREQSRHYLDRAQMTYRERLREKVERTQAKATRKLARFKARSAQSEEAEADMSAYMTDFVADLVSQGVSEQEAFERASAELAYNSGTSSAEDIYEHYASHYADLFGWAGAPGEAAAYGQNDWGNGDAAYGQPSRASVAAGLYYSGGVLVGCILGALIGLLIGLVFFVDWFWLAAIIGFLAGAIFGTGCAMLLHARAIRKK